MIDGGTCACVASETVLTLRCLRCSWRSAGTADTMRDPHFVMFVAAVWLKVFCVLWQVGRE
jgi:hypothetical protein